jgi:5,10-methylenetetrahydrofolate reductase
VVRTARAGQEGPARGFELICEIEAPRRPDLTGVREQVGVLAGVADGFLVPDNRLGQATVSSIAVAHEVQAMGGRGIACVNSRDRNLLGLRRDLLTAAAYGVGEFLFVHGDRPTVGQRAGGLTVRAMMDEARAAGAQAVFAGRPPLRVGTAAGLRPLPGWKRAADFVFLQVSFSVVALLRWREANPVELPVYAGVMVLASAGMARRLAATIPDIDIPAGLVERVEQDQAAGVEVACEQVLRLRESAAFAGVHLVPVSRYRQLAARLDDLL